MNNTISERISNIINALSLNNSAFAKTLEVSSTTIDGYTRGRKNGDKVLLSQPNYEVIHKIVRVHNVNADYILGLSDIMFQKDVKTKLTSYTEDEILDFMLENRESFSVNKKTPLVIEVFGSISLRKEMELLNNKVDVVNELLEKHKNSK